MTNEQPTHPSQNPQDRKLITLDSESPAVRQAQDLNAKIDTLEHSLASLHRDLDSINRSVETGLERLSDKDLDLSAKVAETYKRLGEIDRSYKSLTAVSAQIDSEINKLTTEVTAVADQANAGLTALESGSKARYASLDGRQQQLVSRIQELVGNSRDTNARLTQSIADNTKALVNLEKQFMTEIDALARISRDRAYKIAANLSDAEKAIANNKARIMQLQSVHEALSKRTASLETTVGELNKRASALQSSFDRLDARTGALSASLKQLQEQTNTHALSLTELRNNAGQMAQSLFNLARTEKKHVRYLSAGLLIVVLLIAALHWQQRSIYQQDAAQLSDRTDVVDRHIVDLNAADKATQADLVNVRNDLIWINEQLRSEVERVESRLQDVDDQVASLDGRLSSVSRASRFGNNNVIHGPHWLARQPAENYVIEVTTASTRDRLYETARRYRHYFASDLAYYTTGRGADERYVLVYGNFADRASAASALRRMPPRIGFQRPSVKSINAIRKLL